jgi:tetratricopeptide (TPR) repeat protein
MFRLIAFAALLLFAPLTAAAQASVQRLVDDCTGEATAPQEALSACSKLLETPLTGAQRASILSLRAVMHIRLGDYRAALSDVNGAIQLIPNRGTPYTLRGLIAAALDQRAQAIADLNRGVELEPAYVTFYTRGFALATFGEHKAAITDFTRALTFNLKDRDALMARALLYAKIGDTRNAIADYTQILANDPADIAVLQERSYLYSLVGDWNAARADYYAAERLMDASAPPRPAEERPPPVAAGQVYVLQCMTKGGASVPGYWRERDPRLAPDYDYSSMQRDTATGYCRDDIARERDKAYAQESTRREAEERKRQLALGPVDPKLHERPPCTSPSSMISPCYAPPGYTPPPPKQPAPRAAPEQRYSQAPRSYSYPPPEPDYPDARERYRRDPFVPQIETPDFTPPKQQELRSVQVMPYKMPSTENPPPRPRARQEYLLDPFDPRDMDPRMRAPNYDPNRDPYRYSTDPEFDRRNPYAKHPRYRGLYSPFLGGESHYRPPQTFGPPQQPLGGWPSQSQQRRPDRYNPFAPPVSGTGQRPLSTPFGQPTPRCRPVRNPYTADGC